MKILISVTALLIAQQALSAIPQKINSSPSLASEILSMPEANRKQIAIQQSEALYPELIQISKASDQPMPMRWKALTLAAYLGRDKALPELEAALKSPEWFMRNAALVAMQTYHPAKAPKAAEALIKDKALVVRSAAVEVLGTVKNRKTRDLLWEEMDAGYNFRKKQGLWIRSQILSKLSESPEAKESSLFIQALKDKDSRMHRPAIAALEKLTSTQLGKPKTKMAEKRELWLQWAKANPQFTAN